MSSKKFRQRLPRSSLPWRRNVSLFTKCSLFCNLGIPAGTASSCWTSGTSPPTSTWCQCFKPFYCNNLLPFHGNTVILSRYCSKLPWYFYNTGQKYHGILTLESGGTMVNYCSIFIALAPGASLINLFTDVSNDFS